MRQLISRPTIYAVIGLGVSALLVSQIQVGQSHSNKRVSELDPFKALANVTGADLTGASEISSPVQANDAAALAATAPVQPMERDQATAPAEFLQSPSMPALSTDQNRYPTTSAQAVNAIVASTRAADEAHDELSTLAFDETDFPALTGDASQLQNDVDTVSGYDLGEIDTDVSPITTIALTDDDSSDESNFSSAFEQRADRIKNESSNRPRGWQGNPFINNEQKDVTQSPKADPAPEQESVSNVEPVFALPSLEEMDDVQIADAIEIAMESPTEIATVSNIETANSETTTAHRSVGMIPSEVTPMRSVVTQEENHPAITRGMVPIVIGLPDSIAHKAVHNIEYGKSLSRRGAAYAARQEFYSSLRILAQAHDTQAGGTNYTLALRDGIIALKEAEDFIVSDTETQIGLNVSAVIEGHSTKIISAAEAGNMTAIEAMQRYFSFASHQMRIASGQNVVAAEAFYCLGKLHTVQAKFGANPSKLDIAKAIVFHQTAMEADNSNFRSANELGVLLANSGRLQESQNMLKRSLQIQQLPQAWQNLAVVHQRSGQPQLAQLAHQEYLIASKSLAGGNNLDTIRWVEPTNFNQGTPMELRQNVAQLPTQDEPRKASPSIGQRLKSLF